MQLRCYTILLILYLSKYFASSIELLSSDLLWFGTDEGMSTQMKHIEAVWSTALLFNKSVVLVPYYNSVHYPDLSLPISICDLFMLPTNVRCISNTIEINRTDLMLRHNCRFFGPVSTIELAKHPYNVLPSRYNVSILPQVSSICMFLYRSVQNAQLDRIM